MKKIKQMELPRHTSRRLRLEAKRRLENLTEAAQCAELLVSDIRSAHKASCVENPTAADNLLEAALLPLITEACDLRNKLEALRSAIERSVEVKA